MSIVQKMKGGELGTPDHTKFFNALAQLADIAAKDGNGLVCVAQTDALFVIEEANQAAASGMSRTVRFEIQDGDGNIQLWYNGTGTITPTENCTDADIGIPVISGGNDVDFVDGVCEVEMVMDTDAGVSKTYADGDYVTLAIAIPDVLGVAVDDSDTFVFTADDVIELVAIPLEGSPSATQANAAGAGSFRRHVKLEFQDADGNVLTWMDDNDVTLTPSENVTDADVGAPTIIGGSPVTVPAGGVGSYDFTYDTDAGATKTYAEDDYVTITPAAEDVGTITPGVTGATVEDTFVA